MHIGNRPLADRACDGLRAVLAGSAVAFIGMYVVVALIRLRYPFELEWMEGGMVDHVRRIVTGQPLYAKPSLDFVSYLYPPLYYLVAAGVSKIVGLDFLALRLVSFLSSLGVFALLVAIVRRETGSAVSGLVAAGLFAATYQRTGLWFDLARLDSFYMVLLLGAVYVLRRARSATAAVGAGLLMGAAFLTKQSGLVIFVPLALGALIGHARRGCWFIATAGLVMAVSTFVLDRTTGGWFAYYCFTLPANHPGIPGAWTAFWTHDVFPVFPVACLASFTYIESYVWRGGDPWRLYYPLLAAGMIGTSWSVRTMVGAEVNNLMPAYAGLCLLAPLGLHAVSHAVSGASRPRVAWLAAFVVQFGVLIYDPRPALPTPADRAAGTSAIARLTQVEGDVFLPHHGYLALRAGKRAYAHTLAMDNVFLDDPGPARRDLQEALVNSIRQRRFPAIAIESDGWHAGLIRPHYPTCQPLFDSPDVFWPTTGARLRPDLVCRP